MSISKAGMIVLVAILGLGIISPVFADQIACLTPASCASSQTLSVGSWGGTAIATLELYGSSLSSGSTYYYFVCPTGASPCASGSGTDATTGWSWTFSTASGTTGGTASTCSAPPAPSSAGAPCEGNGNGNPGTLTLTITSPSTPNQYQRESLTVYACSGSGSNADCDSVYTQLASLTVISTVPQFAYGIGIVMVVGVLGLVLVRKASLIPRTVPTA